MQRIYLLTGRPGTGKTSLIKQVLSEFPVSAGGFYTEEIRQGDERLGFKLVTLDGKEGVFSRVDFPKKQHVGKYGVDLNVMDEIGVPALLEAAVRRDLVVVDEIGKMELLSPRFRESMLLIMAASKWILGTIMQDAEPFADAVKERLDVNLVTLTKNNREDVLEGMRSWMESVLVKE